MDVALQDPGRNRVNGQALAASGSRMRRQSYPDEGRVDRNRGLPWSSPRIEQVRFGPALFSEGKSVAHQGIVEARRRGKLRRR
jgi:hypothetical protein